MKTQFILYVSNQAISTEFYSKILDKQPTLFVEGMTEFSLSKSTKLGLMPNDSITKLFPDTIPNPKKATHIPKCELYLEVPSVDKSYKQVLDLGVKPINSPKQRDWGDYVGYVMDFDGHIIAFYSSN